MRHRKYCMALFPGQVLVHFTVVLAVLALAACDSGSAPAANLTPSSGVPLTVTSPAFEAGSAIPRDYTCDGANHSPSLQWSDAPTNARSFALIMDDPDAPNGTFTHWTLYDIPPSTHSLPEAVPSGQDVPGGGKQGTNSFNQAGYGGPCPPSGTHHYHFKLYALDTTPNLPSGASLSQVQGAIDKHVLAFGELVGTYSR